MWPKLREKLLLFLPAYTAEKTLKKLVSEIILVDDGSTHKNLQTGQIIRFNRWGERRVKFKSEFLEGLNQQIPR